MFDLFNPGGASANLLMIVKAIAAVGGAVLGWFVSDPLTRVAYRVSFKGATPGAILFLAKASGAAGLGATMWVLVAFGGGGGFLGLGPGVKDGVKDSIKDGVKDSVKDSVKEGGKDAKPIKDKTPAKPRLVIEPVDIEIIDDKRYKDDERFFLVKGAEPPYSRDELEVYLKKNQMKIEVRPVLTKRSIGAGGDDSPLSQLKALTRQYDIKTLQEKIP